MLENNKKIGLTIIVPIYKVEKYIERCVRSLMEQTMKENIEFIFINDCTPDNSINILHRIIKEYPNRSHQIVLYENKKNIGLHETRKVGISIAKGEYIGWCDSDDWVEPEMYNEMYEATKSGVIDTVVCNYISEYSTYNEITKFKHNNNPQECITNLWKGNYFPAQVWTQITRKDLISKATNTIENVEYGEDIYKSIIVYYYSKSIAYVDKVLYHYNKTNNNSILKTLKYNHKEWLDQKKNIDLITQLLYSNGGQKKYHVAVNALKLDLKNHFKSAFKNIYSFYHEYSECYKDINEYSFTPPKYKFITYLVHNIYLLYWFYYRKDWK